MSSLMSLYSFNPQVYSLNGNSGTTLSNQDVLPTTVQNVGNNFTNTIMPVSNTNSVIPSAYAMPYSNLNSAAGIYNITNGFTQTITPNNNASNNTVFQPTLANPLPQNPSAADVLVNTTYDTAGILNAGFNTHGINDYSGIANANINAGYLTVLPTNSTIGQSIPDLGIDPNPATLLSASTQFQTNLATIQPAQTTGYPLGIDPSALGVLGSTANYVGNLGNITTSGSNNYSGSSYSTSYPFASYSQNFYMPFQSAVASNFSATNGYNNYLANVIQNNCYILPQIIPASNPSNVGQLVNQYNQYSDSLKSNLIQQFTGQAQVNGSILNNSGITTTGGAYGHGVVTNPFLQTGFLTAPTSESNYTSGLTFTGQANDVLGTGQHDIIIGSSRNNILNGNGGQDDIIGGSGQNLIAVHPGDQVNGANGSDTFSYDFREAYNTQTRPTLIQGGTAGNNTLILTFNNQDATVPGNVSIHPQSNGLVQISTADGHTIYTDNIQNLILTDNAGNICAQYNTGANR